MLKDKYSIVDLCKIMNVNRSGYYKWRQRKGVLNRYEQDRQLLSELILDTHLKYKSYGYHRIAAVIRSTTGWIVTDNLVHKCCKQLNIKSKVRHYKYQKTGEEHLLYPNIVNRKWNATKPLEIVVSGENMGRVIGKRGETLDALQYLTSLVVNKDKEEYIRINLDSENYRAKRTVALEKLADKVADKVIRNKRNLTLEPMNAFERRVIHSRLQGNEKLTTYSIGEEPSRRIVVSLAKDR